jgi:hypothetical protein
MLWLKSRADAKPPLHPSLFWNLALAARGFHCFARSISEPGTTGVSFTCQDVTAANRDYLESVADHVLIGPLTTGSIASSQFDVFFQHPLLGACRQA